MKRHTLLLVIRAVFAAGVVCALPYSHMKWGEPYPGDGQKAFGMIMVFALIGEAVAVAYFLVGALFQVLLRRKPWRWTALTDMALFLVLTGVLTYGGITAHYPENGERITGTNSR